MFSQAFICSPDILEVVATENFVLKVLRLNQIYAHFQRNPFGADTFLGLEYDFTDIFNNTLSYYSDENIWFQNGQILGENTTANGGIRQSFLNGLQGGFSSRWNSLKDIFFQTITPPTSIDEALQRTYQSATSHWQTIGNIFTFGTHREQFSFWTSNPSNNQVAERIGTSISSLTEMAVLGVAAKLPIRSKGVKPGCNCPDKGKTCFIAGTLIYTNEGYKPIETIQVGDSVWAYDIYDRTLSLQAVLQTFTRTANSLLELNIKGEIITTTPEHPFYSEGNWREACDLSVGDSLLLFNGKNAVILDKKIVKKSTEVFNFEVQKLHNYFVGKKGILVHNSDCIPWSSARVQRAANRLLKGEDEVTVANKSQAEELFLRLYQGNGYKNTTNFKGGGGAVKNFFRSGKKGTYHWDIELGAVGRVMGHGINNRHGNLPHLQIHTFEDRIIRIFYEQ